MISKKLSTRARCAQWLASTALAGVALAPLANADVVVTTDGRILEVKKAREKDGGYVLEFEHGTIVLKDKSLVKAVEIEGDMADYVPQNDDEKQKLAQGFVRYRSQWWSKPAYLDELRKKADASKKRADDLALHSDFSNAWQKQTRHFTVNSNTSPELLNYYCDLLETYYSLMDDRFGIKPSPTLARTSMVVNIYKNRDEFHDLNAAGLKGGVAGYFSPATKDLNFYHDYAEPGVSEWVSLHECTHLLTYLIDPQIVSQIWLNEAIADYFGSSEITVDKKGKITIKPGKVQTDRVLTVQQAITEGNDIKLEKLFTLTKPEFQAFEYSHAWSFIYFLNEANPKYKKGFDKFFKELYTRAKSVKYESVPFYDKSGTGFQASPEEIRRIVLLDLGVKDVDALEKEWKAFIAKVPIEGAEARFKRAFTMVAYGQMWSDKPGQTEKNQKQALDDLNAAIDGGIKDPRAWATRSELLMFTGQMDKAKEDIAHAVELDPLNAGYRWRLGMLLYGFGARDHHQGSEEKPKLPDDARTAFELAIELAPDIEGYKVAYDKLSAN
jgi:tetratricopeptide (TPR) repeat protein